MKALLTLLLLASIASPAARAQTAPTKSTKESFSISIRAPYMEIKAGTPVEIRIRITNTSDHDMSTARFYVEGGLNEGYNYYVFDASGKSAKKREILEMGSLDSNTLKPGESREDRSLVSCAYEMTRPGKYTIQVSKRASNIRKNGMVKSNKISVTLIP